MEIIFIRHGKPDYTIADERKLTYFEKNFSPLDRGQYALIETAARDSLLQGAELILSSPYTRALQTAEIINRYCHLPLFVEFDLHEWKVDCKGKFIGPGQVLKRYDEFTKSKGRHTGWGKPWESGEQLCTRVTGLLAKYTKYTKVIVVCHGALIQSVTGRYGQEVPLCGIVPCLFSDLPFGSTVQTISSISEESQNEEGITDNG